jgi:SAM-dependent methyltransferase
MNALAVEQLATRRGESVLEVGFGGGALLRRLVASGADAWGIDVSEAMVRRAGGLNVRLARADALPFENGRFDKVVSVNSLYFWPEPQAALAEMARVLNPGGRLFLCFEPPEELRKWPGHRHGFRLFEVAEVRALMEQSGFGSIQEAWGTGSKPDRFCCLSGLLNGATG